jgi:hypothetical protein
MAAYVTYGRAQRRASLGVARDSARGSGSLRARCALASGTSSAKALRLAALAAVALFGMAACGKLGLGGGSDEMSWARAALERNDRVEIVAVDPATNTFTVRIKETGDLRTVRADQVIAGPPGAPVSLAGTPAGAATMPAATAGVEASATSDSSQAGSPGASAPAAAPATTTTMSRSQQTPAPDQDVAATSAPRTGFRGDPAPRSEVPNPNSDVASITPGGRVLESGPGYAIKAASKSAPVAARTERERSSTTSSAIERRHDPIICQGDRLLQIDNRNLEFDGDAVAAEDGCEIHITNSHITAKGVGVSARHANVHIDNSQIEGDSASIDASEGAQVYASSSRFKGISRRLDNSSFHDLGGNVWN